MGAVYMSVAVRFGVTWDTVSVLVLVTCLFCLSLIDLETLEIPNTALIIPAAVRLASAAATRPRARTSPSPAAP